MLAGTIGMQLFAHNLSPHVIQSCSRLYRINRQQFLRTRLLLALLGSAGIFFSTQVSATIYRCNNDANVITLSNVEKGPRCKKMVLPPLGKKSSKANDKPEKKVAGEAKKDKSSKGAYDNAYDERKRIIFEEVELEKARLEVVKNRIQQLGGLSKKTASQLSELNATLQKQESHQNNIKLLEKELLK